MSLDSITSALENFDMGAMMPDLFSFLSSAEGLCKLLLMISPLLLLFLGLWYLFLPRKEVGSRGGFLTYFALGSEEAWLYTQKMAGLIWSCLGGVLTIVMIIVCVNMSGNDLNLVADTTKTALIWQIVLVFLSWLALNILPFIFFSKDGRRKR